jgi:hypothetical protein
MNWGTALSTFVFFSAAMGCGTGASTGAAPGSSSTTPPHAPPGAIPAAIALSAGSVTEGTFIGTLRRGQSVGTYRISKTPTTVGQFRQCVQAGACAAPTIATGNSPPSLIDGPTYVEEGHDSVPLVGISADQATAYCSWVGGALPTPAEWMLAARGGDVQRHPWGHGTATCTTAPRTTFFATGTACCGGSCVDPATFAVGEHSAGDSPTGLADVAMLRAELLRTDPNSVFPACTGRGPGCAVSSLAPGSIDLVTTMNSPTTTVAGVRCVWEGGGQ